MGILHSLWLYNHKFFRKAEKLHANVDRPVNGSQIDGLFAREPLMLVINNASLYLN